MRLRLGFLWILPAALLAADVAAWFWAEGQLSSGLDAWTAERRAAGWTVAHGEARRGGWPFAAVLTVDAPQVALPAGLGWSGESLALRVGLSSPGDLTIAPQGAQTLRFGGAPPVAAFAAAFSLDVPLAAAGPVELLVRDLRLEAGGAVATAGLVTGRVLPRVVPPGRRGASVSLAAEAVALPDGRTWALGPRISSATADVVLDGPADAPDPRAWRDGGGSAELTHFAIGWGPLGASGTGRFGLDSGLQPEGAATVRVVGAAAALDSAVAAGAVAPQAAAAVKAVLALLQGAQDSGGQIAIPFTLRDRTVSAGGVPLARVPVVDWTPL